MDPRLVIVEEGVESLDDYGDVAIAFDVTSRFRVEATPDGTGFDLREESVTPWRKDYDSEGEEPAGWAGRWDLSNWGFFAARLDGRRVGAAAVAWRTDGVDMLAGRRDLALLWDIRVDPECRGAGIGGALFERVEAWARARGCRQLMVETQDINVAACRLYARRGCRLRAVNRDAYPELPDEAQLLWYRDLT